MRAVLAATILLFFAGCDARLTLPGHHDTATLLVQANVAGTPIAGLALEVRAPDLNTPLVFNLALSGGTAAGTLRVPAGSQRTFTARAFDATAIETHRGERTATVRPGENPPISLTLLPLQGSQPLELSIGSYQVGVSPAAANLAPGDTLRLAAAVRTASGEVADTPVQWASLDAAVASVEAWGLVTARAPGEARVVAVYAGTGALARIVVEPP